MKFTILCFALTLNTLSGIGQSERAKNYTETEKARIKAEVEREAIKFKNALDKANMTKEQILFSIDTFKIWQTNLKRQNFDYSTEGMNNSVNEMGISYDKLMNKYYNKLLKLLEPKDKEILVSSQKAWLRFKDLEKKLIGVMANEKYNTGGTIQSNFATGNYFDLTKVRTEQIFNYYNSIIEKQELENPAGK